MPFTQWNDAQALQIPTGYDSWSSSRRLKAAKDYLSDFTKTRQQDGRLVWIAENRKPQISNSYRIKNIQIPWVLQLIFNMQAVRQCSVCAGRAHLRNQMDISLLRTNKTVLRRGAACIRFRRYVMYTRQCHIIYWYFFPLCLIKLLKITAYMNSLY